MSLDLLMGYAGMVSFGHSAFFGVGGYVAALLLKASPGALSALVLPALAAGACRPRHRLLLDPGERRVLHHADAGLLPDVLRGDLPVGLARRRGRDRRASRGRPSPACDLARPMSFHLYLVAVCAGSPRCSCGGWCARRSARCSAASTRTRGGCGRSDTPVDRYKLLAFAIAGTVAGVAGRALRPVRRLHHAGRVLLDDVGRGAPDGDHRRASAPSAAPSLGAAAFILLQSLVSSYTERWMLILGLTFILFVLFAPGGIVGALRGRIGLRA